MKRSQWIEVVQRIKVNWPHSTVPDASIAKWYDDLQHLPADQVTVAVEAFYRDGREFPPNGAQILAKVSLLNRDDPDWGEAWKLAKKASMKGGDEDASRQWLEEQSPAAAEAVRRMCGAYLRYNLDEEGTARAQFRQIFENVVAARKRDDAYAGLPNAGLRGLDRGRPRKLGDALQRALPERSA